MPAPQRRLFRLVLAPAAAALLAACSSGSAASTTPGPSGPPVARVGKLVITRAAFDLRMSAVTSDIGAAGGPTAGASAMQRQIEARVMQSLIIDTVIAQEAAARGLAASDADVQKQLDTYVAAAGGQSQLQTQLAQAGATMDQLRDEIRSQINEERLENLFAQQRAQALLASLRGGADFAGTAKSNSDDAQSAASGGDRGSVAVATLQSQDAPLATALLALQPGQLVSAPVRDPAGYEIVRLDSRTASSVSYHRILVAAPNPYTVKERPTWFSAAIAEAVQQYCQLGQLVVYLTGLPQPCVAAPASPSAAGKSATP